MRLSALATHVEYIPQDQTLHVHCIENLVDLEAIQPEWDVLAGDCVFRSWSWQTTWWRHYGEGNSRRQLAVLLAYTDDGRDAASLRALLPCYVDASWRHGRVLRLLGDGEACSDHVGLLAPGSTVSTSVGASAIEAIAQHLADRDDWDLLDFAGVDVEDESTAALFELLASRDCTSSRLLADRCWAIDLPQSWDEFLALQSKSHRKQLRQLERRVLQSARSSWRAVHSSATFADAWTTLVDLHQRRRQSLGEPGCFASQPWAAFQWDVAQQLLKSGRLRLSTLELDGQPVAAEYHFAAGRTTFAYQGGVEPNRLGDEPGQLSTLCTIQQAIAEGHSRFDLLRGDEPYKAHWRATPQQAVRWLATPPRMWPRVRNRVSTSARRLTGAVRELAGLFG